MIVTPGTFTSKSYAAKVKKLFLRMLRRDDREVDEGVMIGAWRDERRPRYTDPKILKYDGRVGQVALEHDAVVQHVQVTEENRAGRGVRGVVES